MKAITVKQPWASAIIHGGKDVENRTTNIVGLYRGPLAIIAGKQYDEDAVLWHGDQPFAVDEDGSWRSPAGAVIGLVDLVDVHRGALSPNGKCRSLSGVHSIDHTSPWRERNVYHLVLNNPRPLPTPIPITGFPGCRALPADVVLQIAEQLS
ncbi:hypothetical protein C1N74_05415 [Microbacterium sp. SGAir0570]|uniref:hypothetical protein n=1 Tax=Microbacterium sp. SGAir0570 TaxID=2070348 RepID=UPI0010CD046E|nr:hypothetical protein [Microbacterium sp. SGAir0570]QCR39915.1 hypothetical protein C1N74_05415 [Microbacterium sp. SGAir0570]